MLLLWLLVINLGVAFGASLYESFIPTMVGLMDRAELDPPVLATLTQWMLFNAGRHVLTFVAWMFALLALAGRVTAPLKASVVS